MLLCIINRTIKKKDRNVIVMQERDNKTQAQTGNFNECKFVIHSITS